MASVEYSLMWCAVIVTPAASTSALIGMRPIRLWQGSVSCTSLTPSRSRLVVTSAAKINGQTSLTQ
eukprot:5563624-Karenia_brevis.AAC.1